MSTLMRTLRNLRRIGIKEYAHQMANIGDTKAGTLIGMDKYGNKYFENLEEELPLRTRWVDYKDHEFDPLNLDGTLPPLNRTDWDMHDLTIHFQARLDVIHGGQVARRGQASAAPGARLGAKGTQADAHVEPFRIQALQHVCAKNPIELM
ncbi:NADH-ubiquinone oxidoreductase subunit [Pyrenophora tritici-repentis]|uniref:NADH dehydrogenase [ubiquinone] 1 alpha subcomplex subunit n=1 Tax=Pyrenophora tritici-repentis TaxID=45151 RepID=A0A317BAS7_9PLEO|nr:nadh-ubiquinone oxidoreductase subunit protein [Pyrenophora tritici-repentis]KAI0585976.1 nadh-ubiquinone oxidoreductase subunit protein [Pyrenophora tritici-repentis]KAI0611299.1 nadh-ubiquinone oxidoreductase subunit protein [Pyrenophora tritici-repentis]KAI1520972.1 nadh-ubiquinone oxidoreductase protein [Pyrenophora tritici-repentis]KAI1525408.1 NADH-ubiquinone oxidoreductase subunit [Pyrenophora tritici-repentis]